MLAMDIASAARMRTMPSVGTIDASADSGNNPIGLGTRMVSTPFVEGVSCGPNIARITTTTPSTRPADIGQRHRPRGRRPEGNVAASAANSTKVAYPLQVLTQTHSSSVTEAVPSLRCGMSSAGLLVVPMKENAMAIRSQLTEFL